MFVTQKASKYLLIQFEKTVKKWPCFKSVEQMLKEAHIAFWTEGSLERVLHWRVDSNFVPAMDPRHDWDWVKHAGGHGIPTYMFRAEDAQWLRGKVIDFFDCPSMDAARSRLYAVSWVRED